MSWKWFRKFTVHFYWLLFNFACNHHLCLLQGSVCCRPQCLCLSLWPDLLHNFVWSHLYCQGFIFAGLPPSSSTALLFLLPTFSFSVLLKKRVFRASLIRCLSPGSPPLPPYWEIALSYPLLDNIDSYPNESEFIYVYVTGHKIVDALKLSRYKYGEIFLHMHENFTSFF